MLFITKNDDFIEAIKILSKRKKLFIDTEFYHQTTYYAKLCLIQISSPEGDRVIIDALSITALQLFNEQILQNPNILKIFHATKQDFRIFLSLFKDLPINVVDTQIMASILGYGDNVGYAKLCKLLLNLHISKALQNSNWSKRPLTQNMLNYAMSDTEHLIEIYNKLYYEIKIRDLDKILANMMQTITKTDYYNVNYENLLNKLYIPFNLFNIKNIILEIIKIREEAAMKLNLLRGNILSDKEIIIIAQNLPTNITEINKLPVKTHYLKITETLDKIFDICKK